MNNIYFLRSVSSMYWPPPTTSSTKPDCNMDSSLKVLDWPWRMQWSSSEESLPRDMMLMWTSLRKSMRMELGKIWNTSLCIVRLALLFILYSLQHLLLILLFRLLWFLYNCFLFLNFNWIISYRYNYGKEGKKKNWQPWDCMRIIMESIGPGENHGCPFR